LLFRRPIKSWGLWFFPLPASRPAARTFIHGGVLESIFDSNHEMRGGFAYEADPASIGCHRRCHDS